MAHKVPVHLIEHLERNKHITRVFFNSKGEWIFNTPNKHYLEEKTREQVLSMDVDKNPPETKEQIEVKLNSKNSK